MKKEITILVLSGFALGTQAGGPRYSDWSSPVNLGPVINSPSGERHPSISKDGLSLYFASDRPGGNGGDDIWVSQRASVSDPWGPARNLGGNINTPGIEYAQTFSRDGHWIFFISNRPEGYGGEDIWASYRTHVHDDFAWEPSINLGSVINSAFDDGGPTLVEDGDTDVVTLYFASNRPGGLGDFDIYAAVMNPDGSFGVPLLLTEIDSPGRDTRTAIRHDGLELFITSNRIGTLGALDLWVSTRESTQDVWATPANLGAVINGSFTDGAPALSKDAQTLFFYSNRPGGLGGNDLYMSTRTKLHGKTD